MNVIDLLLGIEHRLGGVMTTLIDMAVQGSTIWMMIASNVSDSCRSSTLSTR